MSSERQVVQLACGHFIYFPNKLMCPALNELVVCPQCPSESSPVIVRISPNLGVPWLGTCEDCTWKRRTNNRKISAELSASKHAHDNSHLVIVARKGQEVYRSDWRQRQLDFSGDPPF